MSAKAKQNNPAVAIAILVIVCTGLSGLIAYFFLMLLSRVNIGRDLIDKHGLSGGTSRLGGVAIIISTLLGVIINMNTFNLLTMKNIFYEINQIVIISILIGFIGLAEDLSQSLSSKFRLIMMLVMVVIGLVIMPELLPTKLLFFSDLKSGVALFFIYLFTTIMIAGFINAGNITDGANGLLAIIFLIFFSVLYALSDSVMYFSLIISLLTFAIYNLSTGRIFLGDFGAYSLSAMVAFKSLETYASIDISPFLLASILVYPCFELSRSLIMRFSYKVSIMDPDNHHLHNYVYNYISIFIISKHIANSFTGSALAIISSGPAAYIFFKGLPLSDIRWMYIFFIEIFLLSIVYAALSKKKLKRNYLITN